MIIEKSIVVDRPVDVAFKVFTEEIGQWWPIKEGFSFAGDRANDVVIEDRVGGRIYEKLDGGDEFEIGTVTAYDPPRVVAFTWPHPPTDAKTVVEVRFLPAGSGGSTRVELRHSGWEALAAGASSELEEYDGGWDVVLGRYVSMLDERS